jgi:hypothetical protein
MQRKVEQKSRKWFDIFKKHKCSRWDVYTNIGVIHCKDCGKVQYTGGSVRLYGTR